MAQSRSTNTQAEALRGVLSNIADMKVMPDADIPYLTNLETMILGYLRAPFEAQQAQQQMSAAGGAPGMPGAMPGGGVPGMGQPAPGIAGPAAQLLGLGGPPAPGPRVPGLVQHSLPPIDELRRLVGK